MKSRKDIVENWLPRYTGVPLKEFGDYILLTNFDRYVHLFAEWHRVPICGKDKPMPSATSGDITIINFGMGSATAATVMDLLSAIPSHPAADRAKHSHPTLPPVVRNISIPPPPEGRNSFRNVL